MSLPLADLILPKPKSLQVLTGRAPDKRTCRKISVRPNDPAGCYRISISDKGTMLVAGDEAGIFYAEQTLKQIERFCHGERPCLELEDWPDYMVRGFYHDVTRGKVPTLRTLLELADRCAHYKINQLQLYIEHTYAYRNHPEIWEGCDPLTAEEIRALDTRCAELHLDLVPSFSTFGHFYTWIHKKFPGLNELERDVSGDPFCWSDRMGHYTLDCRNPCSLNLVREIIREVRPLFRSRYFNICADETFDLGKGRNRVEAQAVGTGRLYVDFLKAIMAEVKKVDAIPMFWGDVIGSHAEFIGEIPNQAIALDWDYSADLAHTKSWLMKEYGRTFFVCPGIASWNTWMPDYGTAYWNISRFARRGLRDGAEGLLNTDWGDYGHIQTLGVSLPGIILGACAAWSPKTLNNRVMRSAISREAFGETGGRLLGILEEAVKARRAKWQIVALAHEPRTPNIPDVWYDPQTGLPAGLFQFSTQSHRRALQRILALQRKASLLIGKLPCPLIAEEIRVGLLGLVSMEEYYLVTRAIVAGKRCRTVSPKRAARHLRNLSERLEIVWLQRNKRSELDRVRTVLEAAAKWIGGEVQVLMPLVLNARNAR